MDTQLRDRLKANGATIIDAVKIVYPTFTLRVATGLCVINGEQYLPADPDYGMLSRVGELQDGETDQAPRLDLTFLPVDGAALDALTAPETQGSRVYYLWGAIDPETGTLVGQAEQPFIGSTDVYHISMEAQSWEIIMDCRSGLDRAIEANEGQRANDPFHQKCWPGEKGMSGVTGVSRTIWWGTNPPAGGSHYGSGGGTMGRLFATGGSQETVWQPVIGVL